MKVTDRLLICHHNACKQYDDSNDEPRCTLLNMQIADFIRDGDAECPLGLWNTTLLDLLQKGEQGHGCLGCGN